MPNFDSMKKIGKKKTNFINIMKTIFSFNFDLYQAFKHHGYTKTWKQIEAVN